MKTTIIVVSLLGCGLALGACHKKSNDDTTPSASAAASAAPAASETASAAPSASASADEVASAEAPPPDSAKVPTQADYQQKAAQTAASQSLDTQVNALEKQITGK